MVLIFKKSFYSTSQSLSQYCKKLLSIDIGSCSMITDLSLKSLSDGCPNLTHINISWCDGITENGKLAIKFYKFTFI